MVNTWAISDNNSFCSFYELQSGSLVATFVAVVQVNSSSYYSISLLILTSFIQCSIVYPILNLNNYEGHQTMLKKL